MHTDYQICPKTASANSLTIVFCYLWDFDVALTLDAIERLRDPKKRRFASALLAALRTAPVYTPAGIYLGERGAMLVDLSRVLRVVNRTIMGLFFKHRGRALAEEYAPWSYWLRAAVSVDDEGVRELLPFLLSQQPIMIESHVFSYRYRFIEENPDVSIWLLGFFGHHFFLGVTDHRLAPWIGGRTG